MRDLSEFPPRLLVVDDNPEFVRLASNLILRHYPGAEVGSARTGEEAIDALAGGSYDIALLDYQLPDIDGLEILGEVKQRGLSTAVIMVTGEGDEQLAADLFRMGAYDYLVKGRVDAMALRRSLDSVLSRLSLEHLVRGKSDALVAVSTKLQEKARSLDTAYEKLREKKEELRHLSEGLEIAVHQRTSELRATTRFLNRVLDATTDHFIIATDAEGLILSFNRGAEAAFGHRAQDVIGRLPVWSLFEELVADEGAVEVLVREARDEGRALRQLLGVDALGQHFVANLTLSRLADEYGADGQAAGGDGFVLLGSDVTARLDLERRNQAYVQQIEITNEDLRRKNEQILAATKLKSQFIANVSHELRTPLNAVIGYADLLLGGVYGELADRQRGPIDGISTRARDLLALINDILDLARVESGKEDFRVERIEIEPLLRDVVETAGVLAVDKALRVGKAPLPAGLEAIESDGQRLRQILLNLVSNAVKFTLEGFVSVEVRDEGDEVEFAVSDSGIGIPASELDAIFDEFRQVDGSSTRQFGGTGLGLSICRKLAVGLGGRLWAESALGAGSTFRLRLPRVAPAELRRLTPDDDGPLFRVGEGPPGADWGDGS